MGGFKSGAADDDWDDDSPEESNGAGHERHSVDRDPDPEPASGSTKEAGSGTTKTRLPWIHRRSSITDGREKTVQLHLQDDTVGAERAGKSDVEQLLGESVKKADLREAALLVGLEHADEVAEVLRDWGYAIE
jgi:hypothetical protein